MVRLPRWEHLRLVSVGNGVDVSAWQQSIHIPATFVNELRPLKLTLVDGTYDPISHCSESVATMGAPLVTIMVCSNCAERFAG